MPRTMPDPFELLTSLDIRGTTVAIDAVSSGPPGSNATITDSDSTANGLRLDLTIPRGNAGTATVAAGSLAIQPIDSGLDSACTNGGTPEAAILDFSLTAGDPTLDPSRVVVSDAFGRPASSVTTIGALEFVANATSNIQQQLDTLQSAITGAALSVAGAKLSSSAVIISDENGNLQSSNIGASTIQLLDATSNVRLQLLSKAPIVTGALSTVLTSNIAGPNVLVSSSSGKVQDSTLPANVLWYLTGLTSNAQHQLDLRQANIAGAAGNLVVADLQASKLLVADPSGNIEASAVGISKAWYLDGLPGNVQLAVDGKQDAIVGAASTVAFRTLAARKAVVTDDASGKIADSNVSVDRLWYLAGLSANVQSRLDAAQDTIVGAASSVTDLDLPPNSTVTTDDDGKLATSEVTSGDVLSIANLASNLQYQLDGKQASITGAATTVLSDQLPGSKVLVTDASGKLDASVASADILQHIRGLRANVQQQLDGKQASLTLTGAAGTVLDQDLDIDAIVVTDDHGQIAASNVGASTLTHLRGLAGNVQTRLDASQPAVTGAASTVATADLPSTKVVVTDSSGKLAASNVSSVVLGYVSGLTSNAQTQLDQKSPAVTGAASSVTTVNVTGSRVLVADATGKISASNIGPTVLAHLTNVNDNVQATIDSKQATITGAAASAASSNLAASRIAKTNFRGRLDATAVPASVLDHLDGLSGNVQARLLNKQPKIGGAASTVATSDLVPSTVVITNEQGKFASSNVASQALWSLDGLTSPVQTQLNSKQASVTGAASSVAAAQLSPDRIVVSDAFGKLAASNIGSSRLWPLAGVAGNLQLALDSKQPLVTGALEPYLFADAAASKIVVSDETGNLAESNVSASALWSVARVTGNVQAQLDAKQNVVTGAATSVLVEDLPASMVVVTDENGKLGNARATTLDLSRLVGVTGNVQSQLDSKQPAIVGAASSVVTTNLDPGTVVVSSTSGKLDSSNIGSSALWYLDGIEGDIQDRLDAKQATITGAASTVVLSDLDPETVVVSDASGKIESSSTPASKLWYLDGVTGTVQDRIQGMQNAITGAASSITTTDLDALRIVVSDGSGKIQASNIVSETLWYLENIASDVQSQLDAKQPTVTGAITSMVSADAAAGRILATDAGGKLAVSNVHASSLWPLAGVSSNVQAQLNTKQSLIAGGAAANVLTNSLGASTVVTTDSAGKLANSTTASSALWYLDGLSGNVQSQLDAKQSTITGAASTVTTTNLQPTKVAITTSGGKLGNSNVSSTFLQYLDSATSNVQAQLDAKQSAAVVTGLSILSVYDADLDGSKGAVTSSSGAIQASNIGASHIEHLAGLRGNVQGQLDSKLGRSSITGAASTGTVENFLPNSVLVSSALGKLVESNVSLANVWTIAGLSSNLQAQLDAKHASARALAALSTIAYTRVAPDLVCVSNVDGNIWVSNVDVASLYTLAGVTSNIQVQLDAKNGLLTSSDAVSVSSISTTGGMYGQTRPDMLTYFGDGGDGSLTSPFNVLLTNDAFYENVTFGPGDTIRPAGSRIFVRGTLDLTNASANAIRMTGNANTVSTYAVNTISTGTGATAGAAANVNATNPPTVVGNGGAGGRGGNGGSTTGGVPGAVTNYLLRRLTTDLAKYSGTPQVIRGGQGGGGGGGGYTGGLTGGQGAGVIFLAANNIVVANSVTTTYINATGGDGGNGGSNLLTTIGGGGGGGGGGGHVYVVYNALAGNGTNSIAAHGGIGGSGRTTTTTGGQGGGGGAGGTIQVFKLPTAESSYTVGRPGILGADPTGASGGAGGGGGPCFASLQMPSWTNATMACSVARRLFSQYTGPLVQVRNDAGACADIGFSAGTGVLDTTALLTHCASGNGTVSVLYDQSGHGYHLYQSNLAAQPILVSSGTMHAINARPTITFNGNKSLLSPDFPYARTDLYLGAVVRPLAAQVSQQTFFAHFDTSSQRAWRLSTGSTAPTYDKFRWTVSGDGSASTVDVLDSTTNFATSPYLMSAVVTMANAMSIVPYANSAAATTSTTTNASFSYVWDSTASLTLGCSLAAGLIDTPMLGGNISECVLADTAFYDRVTAESNVVDFYGLA